MSSAHRMGDGTSGLEDAIAAVVREAALLGANITITVSPVLPIPPMWSPKGDQPAMDYPPEEVLDPPEVEADLITHLLDAPGEQLTLPEFAKLLGRPVDEIRGFLRGAGRTSHSVKDWLYTRFDTRTEDGPKVRTYRLTDAGRKVVLSEAWQSTLLGMTATDGG